VNNIVFGRIFSRETARIVFHLLMAATLITLVLGGIARAQSNNSDALEFQGGIGVIPVTGVGANGAPTLNLVRGVNPGAPWRIAGLTAEVGFNGHIKVVGKGLLLASGNGIGTNAGQSVHATLFCGAAATATAHDTTLAGVALGANGDFRIDDFLSPALPATCDSPVLLIRNRTGVWFAAGIPKAD
jgi:hypothetical protein